MEVQYQGQVEIKTVETFFSKFGRIIGYECDVNDISAIADAFISHLLNAGLKLSYQIQPKSQPQPQPQHHSNFYLQLQDDDVYVNTHTQTLSEQWSDCSDATKLWWKNCANQIDRADGKRMTGWNAFTMMKGSKERVNKLTRDDGTISRPNCK
jgi:hypothetical protein